MAENSMETQMHTGDAAYYKLGIAKLIAYYYLIADFGSRLASNKPVYRHSLRELRDITRESSNIP